MAFYALFVAIELVLMFTPLGFIPLSAIKITTMHIPVIIAGIVLGVKGGSLIGAVFGICSVINATINPVPTSFVFTPFTASEQSAAISTPCSLPSYRVS